MLTTSHQSRPGTHHAKYDKHLISSGRAAFNTNRQDNYHQEGSLDNAYPSNAGGRHYTGKIRLYSLDLHQAELSYQDDAICNLITTIPKRGHSLSPLMVRHISIYIRF